MNVFKVYRGYREFGFNYGLPVFFVECGPGVNYDPVEVMKKMIDLGLKKGSWVVIKNGMEEKGVGVLVEGLKQVGCKVEVEANGFDKAPGWFPKVDRWIVEYVDRNSFNYGALRRIDILFYKGGDVIGFLEKTKDLQATKAIIGDKEKLWDSIKDSEVRIYEEK